MIEIKFGSFIESFGSAYALLYDEMDREEFNNLFSELSEDYSSYFKTYDAFDCFKYYAIGNRIENIIEIYVTDGINGDLIGSYPNISEFIEDIKASAKEYFNESEDK